MSSWCDIGTWRVPIEPTSRPDENDLPSPRQITARTSGRLFELAEDVEELRVHVVVERVVLLGIVVGDRGDRAVDLEPHRSGHRTNVAVEAPTRRLPLSLDLPDREHSAFGCVQLSALGEPGRRLHGIVPSAIDVVGEAELPAPHPAADLDLGFVAGIDLDPGRGEDPAVVCATRRAAGARRSSTAVDQHRAVTVLVVAEHHVAFGSPGAGKRRSDEMWASVSVSSGAM